MLSRPIETQWLQELKTSEKSLHDEKVFLGKHDTSHTNKFRAINTSEFEISENYISNNQSRSRKLPSTFPKSTSTVDSYILYMKCHVTQSESEIPREVFSKFTIRSFPSFRNFQMHFELRQEICISKKCRVFLDQISPRVDTFLTFLLEEKRL